MDISKIKIIIAPSEAGAGTRGASLGAKALQLAALDADSNLFERFEITNVAESNSEMEIIKEVSFAKNSQLVLSASQKLAKEAEKKFNTNADVLFLTGDHSNAAGSVSAFSNHFGIENTGVIWIDAHADLHSPYTTPSGNMHGMPMAALLGKDNLRDQRQEPDAATIEIWNNLKSLGALNTSPKILPKNLVYIGIRDLEEQEWDFIEQFNIKYFGPKEIQSMGIEKVCEQAQDYLAATKNWYISFDVDSIDPNISSGTGTPVPLGLSKTEAMHCFKTFFLHEKVRAFEITEINPLLDEKNAMSEFVLGLLMPVLGS